VDEYAEAIYACAGADELLQQRFTDCVPGRMNEAKFWAIYFYKATLPLCPHTPLLMLAVDNITTPFSHQHHTMINIITPTSQVG